MKTKIVREIEIQICDQCGKEHGWDYTCLNCGKSFCYECAGDVRFAVKYQHGVFFCGTGDGLYCTACDQELKKSRTNQLYNAYQKIASLKAERIGFDTDFDARRKLAEDVIEALVRGSKCQH